MKRRLQWLLVAALGVGTVFAWTTIAGDYGRFLGSGATFFQFNGCQYPNPLATPCFYGAIVFLVALVWIIRLLRAGPGAAAGSARNLTRLVAAGAILVWVNFGWELWKYYRPHDGTVPACNGSIALHPVFTPCFLGAVIYAFALLVAWNALRTPWDAEP